MRRRDRSLAISVALMLLAMSSPSRAACGPGPDNCEPSADDVRAKLERLVDAAWSTPHSIESVQKFDARSSDIDGQKKYEVRIFAVIDYSGDNLVCRTKYCPELTNYLVNVDAAAKKATLAGWLFLELGKQGWR